MAPYFLTIFSSLFFYVVVNGTLIQETMNVTELRVTMLRLGGLITPQGEVNFITAIMAVDLKMEVDEYVETQMREIYDHTEHLLQFFKVGQLYMSLPQKAAIEALVKLISYTFGEILNLMPSYFVQNTLKFASAAQLKSNWRQLAFEALERINIGMLEKHVAPHVLPHTPREEKTVQTTTTTPRRIQNDMVGGICQRRPLE